MINQILFDNNERGIAAGDSQEEENPTMPSFE